MRTLQCVGGQPTEFGVKTRTSRRCIDLDDGTVQELQRWRLRLRRDGHRCDGDDWMFCNTAARALNPQSLSQLFVRISHSHPGFTMKTYQHVMPGMSAAAADQFAALLTDVDR